MTELSTEGLEHLAILVASLEKPNFLGKAVGPALQIAHIFSNCTSVPVTTLNRAIQEVEAYDTASPKDRHHSVIMEYLIRAGRMFLDRAHAVFKTREKDMANENAILAAGEARQELDTAFGQPLGETELKQLQMFMDTVTALTSVKKGWPVDSRAENTC